MRTLSTDNKWVKETGLGCPSYFRARAVVPFIGIVAMVAFVLGGGGCATIKRAREAQDGKKAPPGERTVRAEEAGLSSTSVVTMAAAVRAALEYRPAVVQARQELVAAEAQERSIVSAYWPGIDVSAGYTRRTSNSEGTPSSGKMRDHYSGSVGLDVLIYDFGKTPASVRQAVERRLAAEQSLRATRNDVVYEVRRAFFDVCRAKELLQVSEESVRQFQKHLEQVKAYAEVGTRIRYDVTKAEVDLGNARLSMIDSANALVTARVSLNQSLGLAEDPCFQVAESELELSSGTEGELMGIARERHPELSGLKSRERAASAAVDSAVAGLYPSLRLGGDYGGSGSRFPLTWNWSMMVRSAVSLFTGWRETAQVDEAVAVLRSARSRVAEREQQIYLEIRRGLSELNTAIERQGLTELIVREAQESLELVKERYRQGKASAIEVTDAQVALRGARADRVKARFDRQAAVAQIEHAIGGGNP